MLRSFILVDESKLYFADDSDKSDLFRLEKMLGMPIRSMAGIYNVIGLNSYFSSIGCKIPLGIASMMTLVGCPVEKESMSKEDAEFWKKGPISSVDGRRLDYTFADALGVVVTQSLCASLQLPEDVTPLPLTETVICNGAVSVLTTFLDSVVGKTLLEKNAVDHEVSSRVKLFFRPAEPILAIGSLTEICA